MLYALTVTQTMTMLKNLDAWLDKATGFAKDKKFDPEVLLGQRLAPDQLALMKQIQIACDHAKNGTARLTGKTAPAHEDNEKTLAEAKARIAKTLAYLQTLSEGDFAGAAERKVQTPRWGSQWMSGADYAREYMLPNFYFHVTTAYAILRHNGVDLGKQDYLGRLSMQG
jgi:uncharacterized protein